MIRRFSIAKATLGRCGVTAAFITALFFAAPAVWAQTSRADGYTVRQGDTLKITDALWYAAYAGAYADSMSLAGHEGLYNCNIDGRNAQLHVVKEVFMRGANAACFAGSPDCRTQGGEQAYIVRFRDFGHNNNPQSPWVVMRNAQFGPTGLQMYHENSNQPWLLRIARNSTILDPQTQSRQLLNTGPFSSLYLVTEFEGYTTWQGARYPLTCSRTDMDAVRSAVLVSHLP